MEGIAGDQGEKGFIVRDDHRPVVLVGNPSLFDGKDERSLVPRFHDDAVPLLQPPNVPKPGLPMPGQDRIGQNPGGVRKCENPHQIRENGVLPLSK